MKDLILRQRLLDHNRAAVEGAVAGAAIFPQKHQEVHAAVGAGGAGE
jgi:hypothetical protein